jgi:copper chaperone CopZ
MSTATYTVVGMTCGHCVNSVTEEVSQVPGVSDVQVDLASGGLTVVSAAEVDDAAVRAAVEEAGYEVAAPANDAATSGLKVVAQEGQGSGCSCGCS